MTASIEQCHINLAKAHATRRARLAAKRRLADGTLTLREALTLAECQTMRLPALLIVQPWWGQFRTRKALKTLMGAGVAGETRIGELTGKQRLLVVLICLSHEPVRAQAVTA